LRAVCRDHFDRSYFHPDGMIFAKSDALFPAKSLAAIIGPAYEAQCRMLCYGPYPTWAEIQGHFLRLFVV
jgi:hypothetical protein